MTDINRVVLIGRLTRDLGSDERSWGYLPNGQARANISIAVNRSKKQGEEWVDDVSYFDIVIFGKIAENLKPYLLKGKQIAVEGYLKQDRWQDQQGNTRSRISIVADTVQLLGGKNDGNGNSENFNGRQSVGFTPKTEAQQRQTITNDGGEDFPEDIPF